MIKPWLPVSVVFLILFNHLLTLFFSRMLSEHLLCARDCAGLSCPCLYPLSAPIHHRDDWGTRLQKLLNLYLELQAKVSDLYPRLPGKSSMAASWLTTQQVSKTHVLSDPCHSTPIPAGRTLHELAALLCLWPPLPGMLPPPFFLHLADLLSSLKTQLWHQWPSAERAFPDNAVALPLH